MKRICRKISWLLVLAMLFGMFTIGVMATDAPAGTKVTVAWDGEAPADVTEVKLDLYKGDEKINKDKDDGTKNPIVISKGNEWTATVANLVVEKEVEYTAKFAEGNAAAVSEYEASVKVTEEGVLAVSLKAKQGETLATTSDGSDVLGGDADDNSGGSTDDPAGDNSGDNSGGNADNNAGDNAGDNSGSNADNNAGDNAGDNAGNNGGDNAGDNTGDNSGGSAGNNAGDNAGDNAGNNGGDNAGDNAGDNSGGSADNNAGDNSGDNAGDNSGDNAGDNAGDNSGDDAGNNGGDNAGDNTVPETKDIKVTINWSDANNQDGVRPESVNVQLYNGETAEGEAKEIKAATDGTWTYTYTGLDKAGEWSVDVASVPKDYTVAYAPDASGNITITFTHTPATVNYTVTVNWDDNSDQLGQRPDSVRVQLYRVKTTASGNVREDVGEAVTIKDNDSSKWTYTYKDLPKNVEGKAVTYKYELVEEPSKYSATYNYSTGVVKLTNGYKDASTIDLKVVAKWVDNNDKYDKRPSSITVTLYANDAKSKVVTIKPDSSGNWSYTFNDLTEYKSGEKIDYEIKVTSISNYVSKVKYTTSGSVKTATITNTYSDIPLTGDSNDLMLWITVVIAAAAALMSVVGFEVRKNKFVK